MAHPSLHCCDGFRRTWEDEFVRSTQTMVLESNDDPERDDEPDEEPDDEPDDEPNRNPTTSRMTHPTATPARSTSGRTTDGRPITSQPQLERTPWAQQIRFLWYKVDAHDCRGPVAAMCGDAKSG